MTGNNQSLFFSADLKGREFTDVLKEVQEHPHRRPEDPACGRGRRYRRLHPHRQPPAAG